MSCHGPLVPAGLMSVCGGEQTICFSAEGGLRRRCAGHGQCYAHRMIGRKQTARIVLAAAVTAVIALFVLPMIYGILIFAGWHSR